MSIFDMFRRSTPRERFSAEMLSSTAAILKSEGFQQVADLLKKIETRDTTAIKTFFVNILKGVPGAEGYLRSIMELSEALKSGTIVDDRTNATATANLMKYWEKASSASQSIKDPALKKKLTIVMMEANHIFYKSAKLSATERETLFQNFNDDVFNLLNNKNLASRLSSLKNSIQSKLNLNAGANMRVSTSTFIGGVALIASAIPLYAVAPWVGVWLYVAGFFLIFEALFFIEQIGSLFGGAPLSGT